MFPKDTPPLVPAPRCQEVNLCPDFENRSGYEGNHRVEPFGQLVLGGGAAFLALPTSTDPRTWPAWGLGCVLLNSLPYSYHGASIVAQVVKNLSTMQEIPALSLGEEDPLEKEMATHSSILVWEISWTGEPGGLQSMGSQTSWT